MVKRASKRAAEKIINMASHSDVSKKKEDPCGKEKEDNVTEEYRLVDWISRTERENSK